MNTMGLLYSLGVVVFKPCGVIMDEQANLILHEYAREKNYNKKSIVAVWKVK